MSSVTFLGPGRLAPIQPPCLPLKPAVGTQTLAHPHLALIRAIISVIERLARVYLQADVFSRLRHHPDKGGLAENFTWVFITQLHIHTMRGDANKST
eukprot:COSAG02_NODE_2363_length_9059_cov_7.474219_8_plen_97_part_00